MPVWVAVAAWIGEQLASGVVSHIGASVWSRMTGEWDIRTLYNNTIAEVQAIVNQAVDRIETDQATDSATTAKDFLNQYLADKTQTSPLEKAEDHSLQALSTFKRMRLPTIGNFMVQAGLHLSILQERYAFLHTPGQLNVIRTYYNEWKEHTDGILQEFYTLMGSEFSPINSSEDKSPGMLTDAGGRPHRVIRHTVTFWFKGPSPSLSRQTQYIYYTKEDGSYPIGLGGGEGFNQAHYDAAKQQLDNYKVDVVTAESKRQAEATGVSKILSIRADWAKVAQV